MAQHIKANGEIIEVKPKDGKRFNLEELQGFVGGFIEHLALGRVSQRKLLGQHMFLNEEGKLQGLPFNERATELARTAGISFNDFIVGDVLVVNAEEFAAMEEDEDE